MKECLILGATCLDMIVCLDQLPNKEDDINTRSLRFSLGGMAYNVYSLLKSLNVECILGSPIGTGEFAMIVQSLLAKKNILPITTIQDQDNGVCMCLVDETGERSFISHHGAEYLFDPSWFNGINFSTIRYIYFTGLELEEQTGRKLVSFLRNIHKPLFFAIGPRLTSIDSNLLDEVFSLHPILHLNQKELKELSGINDIEQGCKTVFERTRNLIIVTMSSKGSMAFDGMKFYYQNGVTNVNVVDTIGAGDAHAGACLYGLIHKYDINKVLTFANTVGALAVSVSGSTLDDSLVATLLKEH